VTHEHTRQFTCKDCGDDVFSFGVIHANDEDVCMTCKWLRSIEDPQDRANLAAFLRKAEASHG
jgi:hypothetical protein